LMRRGLETGLRLASGSLQDSIGFYDRHSRLQGAGWPHVYQK
jgi:hypothetical protein